MARSTAGSPTSLRKPKDKSAATNPTIMPRRRRDPVMTLSLEGLLALPGPSGPRSRESLQKLSVRRRASHEERPRWLNGLSGSVAGEAEQMPSIMHEFVHIHALDDRGRALLRANKIQRKQE